jgi:2-dehydro-3-deoxy-D-gluconate 5-dehydrogenase
MLSFIQTALASAGADIISIELPNDPGSKNTQDVVAGLSRKYHRYECDVKDLKQIRSTYQKWVPKYLGKVKC